MTASSYERAFALVLVSEGGFVNNPADPGGATNLGITIATLRAWRGRAVSIDDVRNLTKAEAGVIYRKNYWDAVNGDQLPQGVDYAVFDFAVNSGPKTAAKFLQRCLSVVDDGSIGPITLKAISQVRAADLVNSLCDRRIAYLRSLGTWVNFGPGWSARIARVRSDALQMALAIVILPTLPPAPPAQPDQPPAVPIPPAQLGFWDRLVLWLRGTFG